MILRIRCFGLFLVEGFGKGVLENIAIGGQRA
jgi:hypothetical protein